MNVSLGFLSRKSLVPLAPLVLFPAVLPLAAEGSHGGSLLVAGVSQFKAGGVGGWLRSLLVAGVSRFKAGGVGGWL